MTQVTMSAHTLLPNRGAYLSSPVLSRPQLTLRQILCSKRLRPSLPITPPSAPAEAHADREASRVMRMPDPAIGASPVRDILRRKCADCENDENIQRKETPGSLPPAAETAVRALGPGAPLPASERAFFEPRFGRSLEHVLVHDGAQAGRAASAVHARAFALGPYIAFGAGEYQPGTQRGRELMAHEIAHTMQPSNGGQLRRKVQVNSGLSLNTQGFSVTKSGDTYTCPKVVKSSVWNEIFTAMLFSPRTFKIAGATNAEMNKNFVAHMAARLNITKFADKKKYTFPGSAGVRMNPAFWASEGVVKSGVERKDAIADLNSNPKEYSLYCWLATKLTMEGGSGSGSNFDGASADEADWIPGDWGYIENIDFPKSGGTIGLEGENLIYVGNDLFWGHFGPGIERKTLGDWLISVDNFPGPSFGELTNIRTITKVGLE